MTDTDWTTNNYNTYIAKYLKKKRLPGKEIWSVNIILDEKLYVFLKNET